MLEVENEMKEWDACASACYLRPNLWFCHFYEGEPFEVVQVAHISITISPLTLCLPSSTPASGNSISFCYPL
jgi:hypothetical protein